MCGLAGQMVFPRADAQAVVRAGAQLAHRGPDGSGLLDVGCLAIAHKRLSIIDLGGGSQPIWNEDRTVAVAFNGEIYNHRALRQELLHHHTFRTRSDTEVLVHLFEERGEALLPLLRGMFALAVWDARAHTLLLARDAFGEKPLVYALPDSPAFSGADRAHTHLGPRGLSFASEASALAVLAPRGAVDPIALADYLALLYVPAPRTIDQGLRKLSAGHLLLAREGHVEVRRWHVPAQPGSGRSPALEELRTTLVDAVALRLESDVPVAALLSGGLDSSAVVALLAGQVGPGLKTFSVGFGAPDDELSFARLVAERYHTDHRELLIKEDALAQTREALAACPEPFGDSSIVPTVAVCKAVAREVKVVLTGDGGDELFAGYGRVRQVKDLPRSRVLAQLALLLSRLPSPRQSGLARAARTLRAQGLARALCLTEVFSPVERAALLGLSTAPALTPLVAREEFLRTVRGPKPLSDADEALAFDLGVYLPDDLLFKVDTASMHASLEARAPLLDVPLAALAVPAPAGDKLVHPQGKTHLRAVLETLLPAAILSRKKRGFGAPIDRWFQGPLAGLVNDHLLAPGTRLKSLLDARRVDACGRAALAGRGNPHQAFALLALALYLERSASTP